MDSGKVLTPKLLFLHLLRNEADIDNKGYGDTILMDLSKPLTQS